MDTQSDMPGFLASRLTTSFIGRQLHYLSAASSTQDVARSLAEKGAIEGTAVLAGRQTSGRGRMGRSWLSPEGGLATSIILRPDISNAYLLPAISSLAAMHAIKSLGIDCGIKWPNDVLITGKKACGILIEHGMSSSRLDYSILGIGINVNFDTSVFPEIADIATSISMHLNHEVPVAQVAMLLYSELERLYLKIGDPPFLLSQWEGNMVTIGRPVTADFYGNRLEGIAKRVSSNGSLVLQQADGTEKEIIAGDVILRQG